MICILGMHRSGTSCVAGTLQAAGVHLGDVYTANRNNLKGNRENRAILALHNDILRRNGGNWCDPPSVICWTHDDRIRRDAIIAELSLGTSNWGFKDPRSVFTLDGWLEVTPHPVFVGVVRHPRAVARSLASRNSMPADDALHLWRQYNRRLADYCNRFKFSIVNFDLRAQELRLALRSLCDKLNLDPAAAETFFDCDLRHHDGAGENWDGVPNADRALYEELSNIDI